jgi:hypothetical protein
MVRAETEKITVGSKGNPVELYSEGEPLTIRATLDHKIGQDTIYRIKTSACIASLSINGKRFGTVSCPKKQENRDINLGPYLRNGTNELVAEVQPASHATLKFDVFPAPSSKNKGLVATSVLWLILIVAWSGAILRRWVTHDKIVILIFIAGIVIRWRYLTATPYDVRAYDWWGHLDYISFLSKRWALPPGGGGWEFHQAPLYYALAAVLLRICRMLGWQGGLTVIILQHLSLALSILVQMAGTWLCSLLLRQHRLGNILATAGIATLPALAMTAARLSNDILVTLWITLGCLCLLRWWETKSLRWWIGTWIVASLAFLTKMNGIVLAIAAIMTLLSAGELPWKQRLRLAFAGIAVFTLLAGWLPVLRLTANAVDTKNFVLTGKSGINRGLCGKRSLEDYLIFNPAAVIEKPFVSTWSDESRRKNYWEFFFRSTFFGEFSMGTTLFARLIIACAILCIIPLSIGIKRSFAERRDRPLLILAGTIIITSVAYAVIFRCYPEQDFRFSLFLGIAGSYFVALGAEKQSRDLRILIATEIGLLWILCTMLLLFVR